MLNNGSGMAVTGGKLLQSTEKILPDVKVVLPNESKLTVAMADGRRTFLTQQACLLTVSVSMIWVRVGIKLAMKKNIFGNDVLIFRSRALRVQLGINIAERLIARALESGVMETDD